MTADLLERLAAATEGSAELDFFVWWYAVSTESRKAAPQPPDPEYTRNNIETAPRYTTSLDAALTLRLPWMSIELTESAAGPPTFTRARIWDWRRSPTGFDPGNEWKSEGNRPLPLNFCSAIIKARGLP